MKNRNKKQEANVCGDCYIWEGRGDGYGTCCNPGRKAGIVAPRQTGNLSRKTIACESFKKCSE